MDQKAANTAHLIDTQPVLILGCSNDEVMKLASAGFVAGLILGLAILLPLGLWYVAIPLGLLSALATVYWGGRRLGKAKEGKPDGYMNKLLAIKLSAVGMKCPYITYTGQWRIRR